MGQTLAEAAVEGRPVRGRRQELEAEFTKAHAGPGLACSDSARPRVARIHEHDEPVGLIAAAKTLNKVYQVKGRFVVWRIPSIGWQM